MGANGGCCSGKFGGAGSGTGGDDGKFGASLVPRPFVGETAWQLTRVQTVYGYDVKEITAPPVQAMNIG